MSTRNEAHSVAMHIDSVIGLLPPNTFANVCEALRDLLLTVHETAASEASSRTLELVETIADDLGLEITHDDNEHSESLER